MTDRSHGPVQHLIHELERRHGIGADVALDMLHRAARRRSVSVHDLAVSVLGPGAVDLRRDQAA